jgi:hypothetical protein
VDDRQSGKGVLKVFEGWFRRIFGFEKEGKRRITLEVLNWMS